CRCFFFQAEDGIRDYKVTGVQTCALPIFIEIAMEDGAIIRIRQHGNLAGPRLALSHGNGLAIDGYLPFWDNLRDRYELILFDFRSEERRVGKECRCWWLW